jgi:hypothetical protein
MQLHFPGALGMILSGMLLRNVNNGLVIQGLRASWSQQIRAAALAIIFLRSGLEIDLDVRFGRLRRALLLFICQCLVSQLSSRKSGGNFVMLSALACVKVWETELYSYWQNPDQRLRCAARRHP